MKNIRGICGICLWALCFLQVDVPAALAGIRYVAQTENKSLVKVLRDERRPRIYLLAQNQLYVIDSNSETMVARIVLNSPATDMAINKSSTLLDVAANGGITEISLVTLKIRRTYFLTGFDINTLDFDYQDDIYAWAWPPTDGSPQFGWVYKFNKLGQKILQFGYGPNLNNEFYQGLVRTDAAGTGLYVGEKGQSPAGIFKFDISNPNENAMPVYLMTVPFGTMGSNLQDFVPSPIYNQLYVTCGAPYGLQILDSNSLTVLTTLQMAAYPSGVDVNVAGDRVYGTVEGTQNTLYEFDAGSLTLLNKYNLLAPVANSGPVDVAVSRSSNKVFVIDGNSYPPGDFELEVVDVQTPPVFNAPWRGIGGLNRNG